MEKQLWAPLGVGLFITFVGYVWLFFTAFRKSVLWGLVVLICPGLLAFRFMFRRDELRPPFLVFLAGALLCGGTAAASLLRGPPRPSGASAAQGDPPATAAGAPRPDVPAEEPPTEATRLRRACEAARTQILQGRPFPALATEGWEIDLWLASRKSGSLHEHAALVATVAAGRLTPSADEELAAIADGTAALSDGLAPEDAKGVPGLSAALLRMGGGHARAYLTDSSRGRFVALADRLFTATGAEMGALFGRCAHLPTHEIGGWFRGADAAGAAVALVYQMGMFQDAPAVSRSALAAIDPNGPLAALQKAASKLRPADLADILPRHGGALRKAPGVTAMFALAAPAKATFASRSVAAKMGVGSDSE